MEILKFDQFISESMNHTITAGVAIIYENKILLIHPTNSSWHKGTCGIPKGHLENGEDPLDCAIRELKEETGILISPEQLELESHRVDFYNGKKITGHLVYFICNIDSLSEINLDSINLPKSQLQLEEVDWGKFVSAKEAYPIMSRAQLIILDRHLTL